MSYQQWDRIKSRAHWLAIEFVFYVLGLLTFGGTIGISVDVLAPDVEFLRIVPAARLIRLGSPLRANVAPDKLCRPIPAIDSRNP
jgi:hypothetical protein